MQGFVEIVGGLSGDDHGSGRQRQRVGFKIDALGNRIHNGVKLAVLNAGFLLEEQNRVRIGQFANRPIAPAAAFKRFGGCDQNGNVGGAAFDKRG